MKFGLPERPTWARVRRSLTDLLVCTAGCLIFAVSVSFFTAPNRIAPGGLTGVATILYYLLHVPIGLTTLLLNIPLLALGLRLIGWRFMAKTVYCTALSSVGVDLVNLAMFRLGIQGYHDNLILAALYGGVFSGIGLGLVFLRGATTGGTDVASRLMKLKFPHISMGRMLFIIDAVIVIVSAAAFRSLDSALYATLALFTSSKVIDSILYGSDQGKMAVIISEHNDEIAKAISTEMDRGVTVLNGHGFYTGTERKVLICAVRRPESFKLQSLVHKKDRGAFIIMCEADEVIGEGFKPLGKGL